jgi:hypothetical protein
MFHLRWLVTNLKLILISKIDLLKMRCNCVNLLKIYISWLFKKLYILTVNMIRYVGSIRMDERSKNTLLRTKSLETNMEFISTCYSVHMIWCILTALLWNLYFLTYELQPPQNRCMPCEKFRFWDFSPIVNNIY